MRFITSIFIAITVVIGSITTNTVQAWQLQSQSFSSSSFVRRSNNNNNHRHLHRMNTKQQHHSTTQLYMKTIAVFGASGLTASECVYQALKNGDTVIGLTRNPSNLVIPKGSGGVNAGQPLSDSKLICYGGDVTKQSDVDQIFDGRTIDGVIVALGGKTADVGDTMLTDGTSNIINAMKKNNVKRIAVVTSIGTGDSENQAPFFFKVLMWTAMKKIFQDKNNQENVVAQSGLEYCIVRPGGLTVDPPTGIINVIQGEAGSIARADVAAFCLGAVTQDDFEYIGQAPCISSVGGTSWVKDRSAKARGGVEASK